MDSPTVFLEKLQKPRSALACLFTGFLHTGEEELDPTEPIAIGADPLKQIIVLLAMALEEET